MKQNPAILKITALSILLLLSACGGGGGSTSSGDNNNGTPDTSGLKKVLPFNLDDNTGEINLSAVLAGAALSFDSYYARQRLYPEDFIHEHQGVNPNNPNPNYPYIDKYIYRNCDSGSIGIKSNIPPPPHSGGALDIDLLTLQVSANECYSRYPNISAPKYVDGIANIKYENIDTDEEQIRLSELNLQDYAIGFKNSLINKNIDLGSYNARKNHSLLLSGTRKTKNISKIDSNTGDFEPFSTSDVRKDVILKHPKGDKVTFDHYNFKSNKEDGTQASYSMKWVVKNTKENIELLGSEYFISLLGISRYGKDKVFPVGNYELDYDYNFNAKTGISIINVDLVSHNISAKIVSSKTNTTVTYNRGGNITVINK